jgi:glycosyltransferase involved in cell wall biosynthesis
MGHDGADKNSICFVGIANLLVLAPEFRTHGIGGAELQQTLLARALVGKGFRVSMIVGDYGQADGAEWDGIVTYKAYRIAAGLRGLRLLHPRATGVWSAMKRAGAQIYYSSCADYLPGVLALFAQTHRRKAVFRVAHDTDCQPENLLIPNWRSKILYRYGLKHVDLILAQSSKQQSDMLQNFGRPSRVVPSLVELGADSTELEARDVQVLWVGNMRSFKRPDLALDLAASMPEVSFHMIGGGEDPGALSLFADIKARAAALPNVSFEGPKSYEEVETRMTHARLLINTSESEGFPNTYMQAWVRGTPVVAMFDPDGIIEREGLGCSASTLDQMRSAIRGFLDSAEEWHRASARCRQYVSARHGANAVDAYVDALGSL